MDQSVGMQVILTGGLSGKYPLSYAETPIGALLMANGVDPVLRWEPLKGTADTAGVRPPATALELGGMSVGRICGQYVAFCRFIDLDGNPSVLSPVSNVIDTGRDGFITSLSVGDGAVLIGAPGHGLASGDPVLIDDVDGTGGYERLNDLWTITVVDDDHFTVPLTLDDTAWWRMDGAWTYGVGTIVYGAVPWPAQAKVLRRQILRNLAGNADVLYVDVDTTNLEVTTLTSTRTDEELAAQEAVPLTYGEDDLPWANRFGVPPAHKSVVEVHQGRAFLAADVYCDDGHVVATFNSAQVRGVGTAWPASFAGRWLYVDGAIRPYEIAAVDVAAQTITLVGPYEDPPQPYAHYVIRPAPGERRLVYYSEPGTTEAWPAYNALAVPETNDEITGLVVQGSYLFVLERRHIHRLTFQEDPLADGFMFLVTQRGCINDRCHVTVEGVTYMLDEAGIHRFDGDRTEHISDPIQNVFQVDGTSDWQVNWDGDQRLWHAAHDPVRNTIRWFVAMIGQPELRHCIAYNYRQRRFWVEEYPTAVTSSCTADLGYRRSLAGTEARRVIVLAEGAYDGVDDTGTVRGVVTAADPVSLTDVTAQFGDLEGAPIAVVDGAGRRQIRVVAANTADTIQLRDPWTVVPAAGATYQVGGIPWQWQSGWFSFAPDEGENPRDVEMVYEPLGVPARVDVRLFYDHEADPRVWAIDVSEDGKTIVAGTPFISFDLNTQKGYVIQRITGHVDQYAFGDQYVSIELSGVQAAEPVRIHEVILSGVSR